ncbi:MAG: geranylgeranylglycerol-phosphate geranylgeranyltransferase [Bacteroidota bacterium]
MWNFLKLIRIQNLLIIALTQYMVRYMVVEPYLKHHGLALQFSSFHFLLLVLATMFIAAAGYIINDYFDRKTDLLNRPEKVLVGKSIRRRVAMVLHQVFSIIGVIIGFYIAYYIGYIFIGIVFPLIVGILWFYSTTYKRQLIIGNVIVSLLTGLVPLMVILFEIPLLNQSYGRYLLLNAISFRYIIFWTVALAGFAFLLNLVREIVKDAEDFEGDAAFGRNSIPIVFGTTWTKIIVAFLLGTTALGVSLLSVIFFIAKMEPAQMWIPLLYNTLFILMPILFAMVWVIRASDKKDYFVASQIIKVVMLCGIFFSIFIRYFFVG